jgi:dUTP pyrophosphatase
VPSKRDEDAGYDIYANFEEDTFVIAPLSTRAVPTGIAARCSADYYVQVLERSSTGKIGLKRSSGVCDSGYSGEYFVMLFNANTKPMVISKKTAEELGKTFVSGGKKYKTKNCIIYPYTKAIAELAVLPVPKMQINVLPYEELKSIPSERGVGGFGASGK